MTKILLPSIAGLLLLAGCARDYVMTLSSGEHIDAATKPKLVNGFYYYKDASGRQGRPIFSGNVAEIAPASMASGNPAAPFKNVQSK